jgi:hypothetical protein
LVLRHDRLSLMVRSLSETSGETCQHQSFVTFIGATRKEWKLELRGLENHWYSLAA